MYEQIRTKPRCSNLCFIGGKGTMVLKTIGLTKKFANKTVVDNINIQIEKGQVYGFIGANGAGKSTTIKMISGLLRPTEGNIELFGETNPQKQFEARQKIGGYVDSPTFYKGMSAKENLEIHKRLFSKKNIISIDEILKIVNLDGEGRKPVKNFSTGMIQRLAIGRALLNSPELIILDEPINGLDPSGIREVRQLIYDLSRNHGITFLISSHILSELEKVATKYGFIDKGRLLEQVTSEVLKKKLQQYILISTDSTDQIEDILKNELNIKEFTTSNSGVTIYNSFEKYSRIKDRFINMSTNITCETQTLESYFMSLIGGEVSA